MVEPDSESPLNLYLTQTGPLEGGGIADLVSNPAISTPAGFALAVLIYLAKLWRDNRAERRADNDQNRTRESHIVDESKDILTIRREEAADFRQQRSDDRVVIHDQDVEIRTLEGTVARLLRQNERLVEDIATLKEILSDRIGQNVENRSARPQYGQGRSAIDRTDPSIPRAGPHGPVLGPGEGGPDAERGIG